MPATILFMATRSSGAARGERRSRLLRHRLAEAIADARGSVGLSLREVARQAAMSPDTVQRVERGEVGAASIDAIARIAETLGLELAASLYPNGDPVRDRAHLALLARFRARLGSNTRIRTEVPIPIVGDLRSGDAVVEFTGGAALVEAETHLGDVQQIERKAAAKQRDLGATRLILLVADTRHNRSVLRMHPELRQRFPIDTRRVLHSVVRGCDPGGDGIIVL